VLSEGSVKILELIRDKCTGISILETFLYGIWRLERYKADRLGTISEAVLGLVDERFKAISSLKEVIVHVYSYEDISDDLIKKMGDYGWTTKVIKQEESEGSGNDADEDLDDYFEMLEWEDDFEYYGHFDPPCCQACLGCCDSDYF